MDISLLLTVVLVLMIIGIGIWAITTYVPMSPPFPQLITAAAVILTLVWLISLVTGHSILHC